MTPPRRIPAGERPAPEPTPERAAPLPRPERPDLTGRVILEAEWLNPGLYRDRKGSA